MFSLLLATHALLEELEVRGRERVGFRDNGDEVDARAEALHDLNIEGLETGVCSG